MTRQILRILFISMLMLPAVRSEVFSAEVVERILAVVNDEIVTDQDLEFVLAPVAAQYRTRFTGPELEERLGKVRQEFLNKIIEDRLILSEAKRKQVIVKDEEVEEMMADVRNKFPNREDFLRALDEQGLSEKKLWSRFKDQLMTQKLVSYEVKSRVSVSPGEISQYYKTNADQFVQDDKVLLKQILVRIGSRTSDEAKVFAESLIQKIKQGESFEELAKNYSEGSEAKNGGDMGWVEKGQLLGEIDQKVFALGVGEITEPIQSALGYHIFKVMDRKQAESKPFLEVKDQIQDFLFKEKLRQRLDAWIQGLKKSAYISIR